MAKETASGERKSSEQIKQARNEDPISGASGAHPVGTGLGAVVGGIAAGAAAGTLAGPVGTLAGAIAGAVAGAYAGKALAESVDPTVESDYWKSEHQKRPYFKNTYHYDVYEPAYRAGWESSSAASDWQAAEPVAKKIWEESWESEGGAPQMTWEEAKLAAQDAYHRVHGQRSGSKPNSQ